jgi:hypothetical protein
MFKVSTARLLVVVALIHGLCSCFLNSHASDCSHVSLTVLEMWRVGFIKSIRPY